MAKKTLVVVPAYNEERSIINTINALNQYRTATNNQFDIVVVDDGSIDRTRQKLEENNIIYIHHYINLGIGRGFKTGIEWGMKKGYTQFINYDADGQHKPEFIGELMAHATNEDEIIIASRFKNGSRLLSLRHFGSLLLEIAIKMKTGKTLKDPTSGMVLFRGENLLNDFVNELNARPEPALYSKFIRKYKLIEIPALMNDRNHGKSYFNRFNSIRFMLEQFIMIIFKY